MTTLKAGAGGVAGLLEYYAGLAEDRARQRQPSRGPVEYYLDPDEPPGRWWGQGRHALALDDSVSGEDLRALLECADPRTGRPLGRRFGETSARGFDATFSAPKSVSVLWALTPDPWIRAEVLAAHDAAVEAALGWLERHGSVTRRGRDGVHQVDAEGLTVAVFRQHTSRTSDPQLHTHALIWSKVRDASGRWLALDARFLKYQQRSIGWVYDAALRGELTSRLGVAWTTIDGGQADIAGIEPAFRDLFSQRSRQVEFKLADLIHAWRSEHDGDEPDARTIAALERRAVVASRPAKGHGVDAAALHAEWATQAAAAGFGPSTIGSALSRAADAPDVADEEIVTEAIRRISEESSTWLHADLARHIAALLPTDDLRAADVVALIDRLADLAAGRCVDLSPASPGDAPSRLNGRPVTEAVTDRRLTAKAILDQETYIQRWATTYVARSPIDRGDSKSAAAAAIADSDRLVLVVGPAGTGKTTATAQGVRQLRARDRPVVGLAPSGKAADVLAVEAGCPTATVASFIHGQMRGRNDWRPGTTVIVDEAGMAATSDVAQLVWLAQRRHWRLVLVGDPAQLPAVGRGGVFAHLVDTLPHHHLETPRRFREPWEAAASLALRAGDPEAADIYDRHGRLSTAHPALLPDRVADLHHRHTNAGQTVAITTNTAESARRINRAIQASRRPMGPAVPLADGTHARVGDTIATRRNDPTLKTDQGHDVRNRHTWTVTAVGRHGSLVVAHPDRGTALLPTDYVRRHVELGWAVTGYGNQGDTVNVGIAVLEPGTTRAHAYVAMTRGRHTNLGLLVSPAERSDAAQELSRATSGPARCASALAVAPAPETGDRLCVPDRPAPAL
ncbi:MAG TPA: MobF family relaxase [Iamia sp.]